MNERRDDGGHDRGDGAETAARRYARYLRELHQAAGSPSHAELVRRGLAHRPPVRLKPASLSDWFAGRSTPTAASRELAFLLHYLETTANARNDGRDATAPERWRRWRAEAEDERRATRRSPPEGTGPDETDDASPADQARDRTAGAAYGDHIDARGGIFHGPVVGKIEYHHGPAPTALTTLPPIPSGFVGRDADLRGLLTLLGAAPTDATQASESSETGWDVPTRSVVVTAALAGMGGVGKTALALALAHAALDRGRFHGALFINLRGYDVDPVTADQALDALLRSLGVKPVDIPPDRAGKSALYRSVLDTLDREGRAMLILADNASAADQVHPLLPGRGHHRLLTTSRHSLTTLGARLHLLGTLKSDEAVDLVHTALRLADPADPRAVTTPDESAADGGGCHNGSGTNGMVELAHLCGHLPLALRIAAALLVARPDQTPADLAAELRAQGTRTRLDVLEGDDGELDLPAGELPLRACFDLSYHRLSPDQAELFRLLPLDPGPDLSTHAAAVLIDDTSDRALTLLRALARAHLIEHDTARGRWGMHDLIRDHAIEKLEIASRRDDGDHGNAASPGAPQETESHSETDTDGHEAALVRLLVYYTNTATDAMDHLYNRGGDVASTSFADRGAASDWLDAERLNLTAMPPFAHSLGHEGIAAHLSLNLGEYLAQRRHFDDLIDLTTLACDTWRSLGDVHGEASARTNLGNSLHDMRRFDEAIAAHIRALELFTRLDDTGGQALAWNNRGTALQAMGRFDEAIAAHTTAGELYDRLDDTDGQAMTSNNLGAVLRDVRRFDEALTAGIRAYDLYIRLGDTHRQATASNSVGNALYDVRRFEEAIEAYTAALDLYARVDDTDGQAMARTGLGNALMKMRRFDEALTEYGTSRDLRIRLDDTHGLAVVWNNLGNALSAKRRFEEAIEAHRHARDLFTRLDDTDGRAGAWNNLGNALHEVRRFDEAIDAHTTALDLHTQLGDTHGQAAARHNLGNTLHEVRRFDDAVDAHTTSRDLYAQLDDVPGQAMAWNGLGNALRARGRFDEAIAAYTTSRDLNVRLDHAHGQAIAWNGLGNALYESLRFDEAVTTYTTALGLYTRLDDTHGAAGAWFNLGSTLTEAGRADEATAAFTEATTAFRTTGDRFGTGRSSERLGHLWVQVGDAERARVAWSEAVEEYTAAGDEEAATRVRHLLEDPGEHNGDATP